jgi:tetratricopeptide (TPR) repeat protein
LNRSEEAIAVYDEVVKRYGEASELTLRETVANALYDKGLTLEELNRSEEAIAVYDEVVKRYGESSELSLRETVAGSLGNLGFEMLICAKEAILNNFRDLSIEKLSKAFDMLSKALTILPNDPVILGNYGYVYFLLGNKEKACEYLEKAIRLGGEETRQAELKDADIDSLPVDKEFKELVLSIKV